MLGLTALTIAIVYFFPKITKVIPASLVAIVIIFGIVLGFGIPTKTVADIAQISGSLPAFHIPELPFFFTNLANYISFTL